jgi:hypothetical protein
MRFYLSSFFFSLAILLATLGVMAQKEEMIAFYNLENLFDIYDDPTINDARFLPDSDIGWTIDKYVHKLDNLAKVISSVDDGFPAVLGVCEVENRKVLEDLTARPSLKKAKYRIVHADSPDERGIDNALLYSKKAFKVVSYDVFPVVFNDDPENKTRDILYVKGIFKKAKDDTLHLFVNHWPSRWGGREKSNPLRIWTAKVLREAVDSLLAVHENPKLILMGDFNDEPDDESVRDVLKARRPEDPESNTDLHNLMFPMLDRDEGTLWYKDWDVFDQFIVSGNLIRSDEPVYVMENEGYAFGPEWLMFKDNNGNLRPNRTAGREYYGGFSDHLLVYIRLVLSN